MNPFVQIVIVTGSSARVSLSPSGGTFHGDNDKCLWASLRAPKLKLSTESYREEEGRGTAWGFGNVIEYTYL